ncbi:MAG TPA: hypothetical protein VHN14_01425 [Kofleriaceae bacterium]|jgi:hypothetical protein|nr:hypothetical protein [Kofleriaceae bacterium]
MIWLFWLASRVADLLIDSRGFLLGFDLITRYAPGRNTAALARGQQLHGKLAGYQGCSDGSQSRGDRATSSCSTFAQTSPGMPHGS